MNEKKRVRITLGTFDLIKGIGILAVIYSHTAWRYNGTQFPVFSLLGVFFTLVLGSGAMPMFFLASGFGFKEKSGNIILKKTVRELLIPYLYATIIFGVAFLIFQYPLFPDKSELIKETLLRLCGYVLCIPRPGFLWGKDYISAGPLWFFGALFISTNLLNLIIKCRKMSLQIAIVAFCTVCGLILLKIDFLYFSLPQGLVAVLFCYTGYQIKKKKILEKYIYSKCTYIILCPFWLIMVWGAFSQKMVFNLADGRFGLFALTAAGLAGVLSLFACVYCSQFEWKALEWIRKIGLMSYWIIIIHGIEMLALPWYELAAENPNAQLALLIEIILKIVIMTIGCMIMKKISQLRYRRVIRTNSICINDNAVK